FRASLREEVLARWGVEAEFAQSVGSLGSVRNAYLEPAHLGVDRWLAILAAYHRGKTACGIIDAGSALTLDFVRADGQHEGGYIVPGLSMQRNSLLEKTAIPATRTEQWGGIAPGSSTLEAIHHGILEMLVQWIVGEHAIRKGSDPTWFLTGGD